MRVGIVGLGLMGGSIAKALKSNYEIHALDRDQFALSFAKEKRIIDYGYTDALQFFLNVDVVYLCLYPRELVTFLNQAVLWIQPKTILIEISGVKLSLVAQLEPLLKSTFELVYSHPIAGREKIGVASSNASIFTNANYIITPLDRNTEQALNLTERLAKEMGFSSISYLSPNKHDEIIAYTSQLTHVLSLALVHSDQGTFETRKFIGDSYRDLTRIAMINAPLWAELFMENRDELLKKIKQFKASLSAFEKSIETYDEEALVILMNEAKTIRLELEKEGMK